MCIIAAGVEHIHAHYLIITGTSSSVVVLFFFIIACRLLCMMSMSFNSSLSIHSILPFTVLDALKCVITFSSSSYFYHPSIFFFFFHIVCLEKKEQRRKIRKQQREKNVKRNFSFCLSVVATTYVFHLCFMVLFTH